MKEKINIVGLESRERVICFFNSKEEILDTNSRKKTHHVLS